jgi:hypothetical protein
MTTDTTTTFNYDILVADDAIASTVVLPELKDSVKTLLLSEQTEAMAAVLRRLNSGTDDRDWQMIKREPISIIAMLLEAHCKRLEELLLSRKEKEKKEIGD